MKKLGLATALLLAMTGAQAYQVEVQGQSEYIDNTVNDKNFTGAVQGTYYFKNVDSSKGPLAEAAFLNQASNASIAYNYGEYDVDGIADKTVHTIGAKAEAYVPTKVVPVYASASYSNTITDNKAAGVADDHGDRYALEVGALAAPNFLVAVGYTSAANQFALDAFNIMSNGIVKAAGETQTLGEDQDAITARAKYVGAIDGTNMAVGFESGIVYGDATAYQFKTDLYLNPKLSTGVSYAASSFAGTPDSAWGANVNYFITPAVAVGANYVYANAEGAKNDTQTVGVNAKFRF
ncbi:MULTISPECIES: porin Omp33-36 [Acinetobacter]|uniref:Carbapenem susceptibility porin CarO n=2 Tax=Acinetobacter TaxID=469 RepID=A0A4V2DPX7_9GAMM|nr:MULTISPECIES: porin Omp33-36 [Acinetobacter]MCW8038486.1 porin Omp33-36 [Acinetobacter entericus]RZG68394.1 carbapenem susceptibility porin CarO [Acinetobacter bouvetii]TCB71787.1 carbapenem susceptibility porin CarO [Acinetobacter sp. ANC 4177]